MPETSSTSRPGERTPADPAVAVSGLTKVYAGTFGRGAVRALDDLSLTVGRGEIFGLLGPNGAGKTTLIKILLGIARATAGEALILGHSVREPSARLRIGYLPENHRFPDFLTAAQMLDLYGRLSGVDATDRKRRIPELLAQVRMKDWADIRIKKFSKGMMQRIGLAQALLSEPDLVFLDEPTDGVDPIGRQEIRDLLLELRGKGMTVFLNSHLLSEVERVCTRVAILNKGKLVREGTVEALTAVGRTFEVVCTPIPEAIVGPPESKIKDMTGPGSSAETLRRYRIEAADRPALNAVLDHLRNAGVELELVQPLRRSLESYFIEVVQENTPLHDRGTP